MKRTSFFYFSLAAIAAGSLVSCQDYDGGFSEEVIASKVYQNQFEQLVGKIDPQHTWGFGPVTSSSTYDMTRGSNDNRNEWESYYHLVVPGNLEQDGNSAPWGWTTGDITQYERAYVYWWFSTHKNPKSLFVNWSDYFIQHVWGQPEHGRLYADGTAYSTDLGMDKLMAYEPNTLSTTNPYEDFKDLNAAGGAKEQMVRQEFSTTLNFQYNSSASTAANKNEYGRDNEHVLVCINGNYYLAFDYHAETPNNTQSGGVTRNGNVERDGYYNDWILKLTPGRRNESDGYTRRIMCEDLSAFDFDFNDIVLDVTYLDGSNGTVATAVITLQAAGGTLPIYIGKVEDQYEAHHLFGVETNVPVNVKNGMFKRPAVIFNYPGTLDVSDGFDANDIDIFVKNPDKQEVQKLEVKIGGAPQKFACANNLHWSQELTPIYEYGYVNFKNWAGNDNEYKDNWFTPANFEYLYKDNGISETFTFQQSYTPNENWDFTEIKDWKWLFDHRADAVTWKGNQAAADAAKTVFTTIVDNNHQTFESQKPYIYVTPGNLNEDLRVISPYVMQNVLSSPTYNIYAGKALIKDWDNMSVTWEVELGVNNPLFGSVTANKDVCDNGSSVTITATPSKPYTRFVKWSDDNTSNPRIYENVSADIKLSAIFEVDESAFESAPVAPEQLNNLSNTGVSCLVKVVGNGQAYSILDSANQFIYQNYYLERDKTEVLTFENITSLKIIDAQSYSVYLLKN